jgi:hypothetical protein
MLENQFYIYRHIRPDKNEVFYVGKGRNVKTSHSERHLETKGRNKWWKAIVAKNGGKYESEIIYCCDTEEEINQKEIEFIKLYGRKDLGLGTLCNLTDGSDGSVGVIVSDETKEKISLRFKGDKHPNYGKKLSPETCLKKSESMKNSDKNLKGKKLPDWWKDKIRQTKYGENNPMFGRTGALSKVSRKVIDISTDIIYPSITDAADNNGLKMKTLYNMLSGHRPNKTTLKFA